MKSSKQAFALNRLRGFTLIESLAVLALIIALMATAIWGMNRNPSGMKEQLAVRKLRGLVELCQSKALHQHEGGGAALLIYKGPVENAKGLILLVTREEATYCPFYPPEILAWPLVLEPEGTQLSCKAPSIDWRLGSILGHYEGLEGQWLEYAFNHKGVLFEQEPLYIKLQGERGIVISPNGFIQTY